MIQILPWKLGNQQISYESYILLDFNSKKIEYVFKNYNGVVFPSKNIIMLLGNKKNLNAEKWSHIINHEVLHLFLYRLGIEDELISEFLVNLLEKD